MDAVSPILMLLLGLAVGTLGTLIGAGGGFILVPVLVFLFPDLPADTITSISLGVVFLNATSGSIAYARMKRIDYKTAIIFSVATLPGAILGAYSTSMIPKKTFDIILALLLVSISIFLFLRPGQMREMQYGNSGRLVNRDLTDAKGHRYKYSFNLWIGIIISFFVGFISSLLGIGGGIIHVPALTSLLHFPIHIATATSHFILAFMALAGTIVHIFQGSFDRTWDTTLWIGAGVVVGAQVGAKLSARIQARWISFGLALALLFVGARILYAVLK